jgi:hypothetical protein
MDGVYLSHQSVFEYKVREARAFSCSSNPSNLFYLRPFALAARFVGLGSNTYRRSNSGVGPSLYLPSSLKKLFVLPVIKARVAASLRLGIGFHPIQKG